MTALQRPFSSVPTTHRPYQLLFSRRSLRVNNFPGVRFFASGNGSEQWKMTWGAWEAGNWAVSLSVYDHVDHVCKSRSAQVGCKECSNQIFDSASSHFFRRHVSIALELTNVKTIDGFTFGIRMAISLSQ